MRATEDIDLLVDADRDNLNRLRKALLDLPDQAVRDMGEDDLDRYVVVRIADEFVVDLIGSMYEWNRIKTTDFEFFGLECEYTDDSVCTAAVAQILLDNRPAVATLQHWCRRHPNRGYGGFFAGWIHRTNPEPYGSFGNGAAMRVSPAAYLNRKRRLEDALEAADRVTRITHDHPEGLKGARAAREPARLRGLAFAPDLAGRSRRANSSRRPSCTMGVDPHRRRATVATRRGNTPCASPPP